MKLQTLIIALVLTSTLRGQEKDPYAEAAPPSAEPGAPNLAVCYEVFSLPLATAAKLQRGQPTDSDLYTQLTESVDEGAAIQETFTMIRVRSGQKGSSQGVSEFVYPTEFEPAELPNQVGVAISHSQGEDRPSTLPEPEKLAKAPPFSGIDGLRTPATPTAFQTRNIGLSLELEATLSEDGREVSLIIAPEHVAMVGLLEYGQELSLCTMPEFESQSLNTNSLVRINQPFLLGTINRSPSSKADPDAAKRVWFAYATVTLPKP